MLNDLQYECYKESGHERLDQEGLEDHGATIVAAHARAELSDVVRAWLWQLLVFLGESDHGACAHQAT